MINLAPIHKKIRETLNKKSEAVARTYEGDVLDPKSGVEETYSRTVWVRMYSPVDSTLDKSGNPRLKNKTFQKLVDQYLVLRMLVYLIKVDCLQLEKQP